MKDTVCIVGSHPATREGMDFNRTDCDIWVFNEAARQDWAKRVDAVFQMHVEAIWKNPQNRNDPEHYHWLQTQTKVPVIYMQESYSEVKGATKYPLQEVLSLIGNLHFNKNGQLQPVKFFNSSIDYALALAIYQGYKRIEVYGVVLGTQTEYFYQRTGFTFWQGVAAGRGIEVISNSPVFDAPMYGYEGEVALKYAVFVERITELEPTISELRKQYQAQQKATEEAFDKFIVTGSGEDARKFHELNALQRELGQQLSHVDGMKQENERYKGKADAMKEKSGDFVFSRQEFEGSSVQMQKETANQMVLANTIGGRCEVLFTELVKTTKEKHRRKKAGQFIAQLQEHMKALFYSALYMGAYEENTRYMKMLDALIKAAGGSKSEAAILEARNVVSA